ncbi:hypothetical protein N8T08_008821 [Aspergillus melleus]|uniref:Uncharacterized protein n=1 Tax=Aspergillus melleus TaxID=138277 RepID=A0ACC3AVR5_9EURO|nr:hypothetical protein N8T08_008821 [Aspergillus melleus]
MRVCLLLVSAIVATASASALGARSDNKDFDKDKHFDQDWNKNLICSVGGISDLFDIKHFLHHICDCPKFTKSTPFFGKEGVLVGNVCAREHLDGIKPLETPVW